MNVRIWAGLCHQQRYAESTKYGMCSPALLLCGAHAPRAGGKGRFSGVPAAAHRLPLLCLETGTLILHLLMSDARLVTLEANMGWLTASEETRTLHPQVMMHNTT